MPLSTIVGLSTVLAYTVLLQSATAAEPAPDAHLAQPGALAHPAAAEQIALPEAPAVPAQMSAADVDASIQRAVLRGKKPLRGETVKIGTSGLAALDGTGFRVELEGPGNRVALYAHERVKAYEDVSAETIPQDVSAAVLDLVATPLKQVNTYLMGKALVTPDATHVVLVTTVDGAERIVQPLTTETFVVYATGGKDDRPCGGCPVATYPTRGIRATFPYAPVSSGDVGVRVITQKKEFDFTVSGKDRVTLR